MKHYWSWWILAVLTTFGIPETIALTTGHAENTLSWYVWKHVQVIRHQPISQWSASHYLFAVAFIGITSWLIGHLVWGIWR